MDLSEMETGLDVGHAEKYSGYRITDSGVAYIDVGLYLHMTKIYWHFVCNWCNLIHEDICWVNNCRALPYYSIVLLFFNNDTLSGMTKISCKFTQKLPIGTKWL